MKTYQVKQTATINAPASIVYNIIADYHDGHQAILPRDYFDEMVVTKGGHGAGTEIIVKMSVMGVKAEYNMVVTEPEPGRIIKEEDAKAGTASSFIVESLNDAQCQVTIHSDVQVKPGLQGWVEKWMNPPIMRRIYREELGNLDKVAQTRLQTAA